MKMHEKLMKRQAAMVDVTAEVFADVGPLRSGPGVRLIYKDAAGRVLAVKMTAKEALHLSKCLKVAHAGSAE